MTALDLLHALRAHPSLTLHRVGEGLKVLPRVPEEARPVLARFKPALLRALEEGERLEAATLLRDPHRLAALLAHALGVEGPRGADPLRGGEPRRYLAAGDRPDPHLAWAHRNLPRSPPASPFPRHGGVGRGLAGTGGKWPSEARVAGRHPLPPPPPRPRRPGTGLRAAGKGLVLPGELSVWRPGEEPTTATGWKEAQAALGVRVGVDYF